MSLDAIDVELLNEILNGASNVNFKKLLKNTITDFFIILIWRFLLLDICSRQGEQTFFNSHFFLFVKNY